MMKAVITGADGQLGLAFQQELKRRGIPYWGSDAATCNITRREEVEAMLEARRPTVLINCAAYNQVDHAETDPAGAFEVNAQAVKILAEACQARGIKFVHYSTDYVFDGRKGAFYTEDDAPAPLNVYGRSKLDGEVFARTLATDHLVLRTSWVYGEGKQNFLYKFLGWAAANDVLRISADEVSVPTYADDLVAVTLRAIDSGLTGLYHAPSSGYASRYEWARYFLKAAGFSNLVIPVPLSYFKPKVERPVFSAMSNRAITTALGIRIPEWQEGVETYVKIYLEKQPCR